MKKLIILLLSALLLLSTGFFVLARDISPAIDILRTQTTFKKYALNGTDVTFTKSDFEKVTGCEFDYITISSLPNKEEGILTLSGVDVLAGQSITADSLDLLRFEPTNSNYQTVPSFTFSISDSKWKTTDICCNINYLSSMNYAPIANDINIETNKNMTVYTELDVYDPEDDEIIVEIKSFPSFGTVKVDKDNNRIVYSPQKGFVGSDMFTFWVEDVHGNKSSEGTVNVKVNSLSDTISFGDMTKSDMHYAAVSLSENNIMTYTKKGNEYYFSPNEAVNKIDFTVMLLCASKLNEGISSVNDTEFKDDSYLSDGRKSYLKRALDVEIVSLEDGNFYPEKTITYEEAKLMVSKSLGLDLNSEELKTIMGSTVNCKELNKENVAEILYNIWVYLK